MSWHPWPAIAVLLLLTALESDYAIKAGFASATLVSVVIVAAVWGARE